MSMRLFYKRTRIRTFYLAYTLRVDFIIVARLSIILLVAADMPRTEKMPHAATKALGTITKALTEANQRAHQWKDVADTRLYYLEALDKSLGNFVEALSRLTDVFGIEVPKTDQVTADSEIHSGEEMYQLASKKALTLMIFLDQLAQEATSVQSTLDDVLSIAVTATLAPVPVSDSTKSKSVMPLTMQSLAEEFNAMGEYRNSSDSGFADDAGYGPQEADTVSHENEGPLRDSGVVQSVAGDHQHAESSEEDESDSEDEGAGPLALTRRVLPHVRPEDKLRQALSSF